MKSTYHPTNSKTDWHKVEMQCMAVTVALVSCMVITCFFFVYEMKLENMEFNVPVRQLWALASFRVLTAFTILTMPSIIIGLASVYLQRKQSNN